MKLKILGLYMALVMTVASVFAVPFDISAQSAQNSYEEQTIQLSTGTEREYFFSGSSSDYDIGRNLSLKSSYNGLENYVDIEEFRNYLIEKISEYPQTVDISQFQIPGSAINSIKDLLFYDTPELFNFKNFEIYDVFEDKIITLKEFSYKYSPEEYRERLKKCEEKADAIIGDIKNSKLSQAEKALLIHDRLAIICKYATGSESEYSNSIRDISGVLVDGVAVCDGYTRAYDWLLKKVGIESYMCQSVTLKHAWNIVIIDGKKYHVDVTQDDVVPDYYGQVNHMFFLLSNEELAKDEGHIADDYEKPCFDTKYDNYFWKDYSTEFLFIDNHIFGFNCAEKKLMNITENKPLLTIDYKWYISDKQHYSKSFTRITTDGKHIYYSTPERIYKYNISTGRVRELHSPKLLGFNRIYGMTYRQGKIYYQIADGLQKPITEEFHPLSCVTLNTSVTNVMGSSQTVNIDFDYNCGVRGYYFGKEHTFEKNPFYSPEKKEITVNDGGTYYLVAIDNQGYHSEFESFSFDKIVLDPNYGSCDYQSIVVKSGSKITLPTPVRRNHKFLGWAKAGTSTPVSSTVTSKNGDKYYALWEYVKPSAATSLSVSSYGSDYITVKWDKVEEADGYAVYIKTLNKTYYTTATEIKLTGLSPATSYPISVTAYVNKDNNKDYGNSVTVTPKMLTGIKIGKSAASVYEGESFNLNAVRYPESATVYYKSSESSVAKVSSSGQVTAVSKGKATITAYFNYGGKTYSKTCAVTVNTPSISIAKASATLYKGASLDLKTKATFKVYYNTSNKAVASVSSSGKITAVGNGTATITAYFKIGSKTFSRTCKVTVKTPSLKISRSSATLYIGGTLKLSGKSTPNVKVYYKTSDKNVASVSSNGIITAKNQGKATITAYFNYCGKTYSKTCKLTVKRPYVKIKSIVNNKSSAVIKAEAYPKAKLYYKSSDNSILKVSSSGKVTWKKRGTAMVTVYFKYAGKTYSQKFQITCR